jgi:hypothetical protein
LSDIAKELGWYSVAIPKRAVDVTARIAGRIPLLAVEAGWLEALEAGGPTPEPSSAKLATLPGSDLAQELGSGMTRA